MLHCVGRDIVCVLRGVMLFPMCSSGCFRSLHSRACNRYVVVTVVGQV